MKDRTPCLLAGLLLMGSSLAVAQPLPTPPPAARDSDLEAPPPEEPDARASGDAAFIEWRAEQERQQAERQQAEIQRLQPRVDLLAQTEDRGALEVMIEQITHSPLLDRTAKETLLGPLRDRQVLLLCNAALGALAQGELEAGRQQIVAAGHAYGARSGTPPDHVTGAMAQAQARYVGVAAAQAQQLAEADRLDRASELLERARGMLVIIVDTGGPAAQQAAEHVGSAEEALAMKQAAATLAEARQAEQDRSLRLALYLYRRAERKGADIGDAEDRINSHRRDPGLEAGMSFVIPGLGQITHGRPLAGGLFLLSTAAAVAGGVLLNASAEDRYDRYQNATDPDQAADLYDGIESRANGALVLFGVAAVLHIWDVLDAYSDAKQYNRTNFR